MDVDVDKIRSSPYQPRLYFDLEELKTSLEQDGMLISALVREKPEGNTIYEIIDGERRWRAAKELSWKEIPVEVRNVDDDTARRMVYTLNEERKPYTLEENTKFFRRMYEQMGTVYKVAHAFKRPEQTVQNYINISMLPEHFQKAVWSHRITTSFIQDMEPLFTNARNEIGGITQYIGYEKSPTYQKIVALCEKIFNKEIQEREELKEQYVDPYLEALGKARIEKAKKEVEKIASTKAVTAKVEMKTPEDLEAGAKALREKAKSMRLAAMTPEEIAAKEQEEQRKKQEREEKKLQEKVRVFEAHTVETVTTEEETEEAKAEIKELVPEGKKTELEEVLETSDLSIGVLKRLPTAIKEEPDKPIIEIARDLHLEATPGIKITKPTGQAKTEDSLTDWVSEVTKSSYGLVERLGKMIAGDFKKVAPKFEALRVDEALSAVSNKIKEYREK